MTPDQDDRAKSIKNDLRETAPQTSTTPVQRKTKPRTSPLRKTKTKSPSSQKTKKITLPRKEKIPPHVHHARKPSIFSILNMVLAIILISVLIITILSVHNLNKQSKNIAITRGTQGMTNLTNNQTGNQTPPAKVNVILLYDASCTQCIDLEPLVQRLSEIGVAFNSTIKIDTNLPPGNALVEYYHIQRVPTLIFDKQAEKYDTIASQWTLVGTREPDGSLVYRNITPPYRDLSTGKIVGLVHITYLVDASCPDCYAVSLHKEFLQGRFGMILSNETTVDISSKEGKMLIQQYNISKVPTVFISKEAESYPLFTTIWAVLGSTEKDGTYVFRNFDALQGLPYKNTTTAKN
jgi:hypothetical protein